MRRIYFDHNATSPLDPAVLAAMLPYFSGDYGNASSVHSFGQRSRSAVERARESVAALIGARPSEIVFTSGGTESDNAAIFGLFSDAPGNGSASAAAGHLITSTIEHPAVLHACAALAQRGVAITELAVDASGTVNPEDIRAAIRPDTRLISVMHANNELGTIQPVEAIGRIASEAGVRFHCDAVQSAGKIPVDVREMQTDLLSLSAHKFGGPQGVGALFVRKGLSLKPILHGGHNERERRAGTENVAGIVGLGHAAEVARRCLAERAVRVGQLRDRLEQGLLARIYDARVHGAGSPRTPNTTSMIFPGVDSEALIIALDLQGLACSAGAACSSGAVDPSHVLTAIGLSETEARASVRLSLGSANTDEEVDLALELIPAAVARQRDLSTAKPELLVAR